MKSLVAVIAAALLPVAVWSAGAAHADATDEQYLQLLASHGVTGQPDQLIAAGRQACDALGQGKVGLGISPYQIAMINLGNTLTAQGFTDLAKRQIVVDASRTYCPQFAPAQ